METKPRLMDGRGNAMLVGASIYQACKFYELFCQAGFKGKCAIVTSYDPQRRRHLQGGLRRGRDREAAPVRHLPPDAGRPLRRARRRRPCSKVEEFEKEVKERFINEPGQMRLLIVVDKLLTGFDAPSATYLYIDKKMQDHGLFQAICRVNRLDGDDKDYGYIVDYHDLFNSLEDGHHRLHQRRARRLREGGHRGPARRTASRRPARTSTRRWRRIRALCEPVAPPKDTLQYQQYFCAAEQGNAEQLKANEPKRVELYKAVAALVRAYANLANEMDARRLHRRRGRSDQGRGRPLRRRARRGEARRRRGHRLQAVRGRHAPPARHLHPGRRRPRPSPTSRTPA